MDKKVENLKLFKLTYELLLFLFKEVVKYFPREFKYTLWEKLKNETLDIVVSLYKTNLKPVNERLNDIEELLVRLKWVEIMCKLWYDLVCISSEKYHKLIWYIIQLRKMFYGWKKLSS